MSPEIQSPIMLLICKTGFSTTDQLSICQAARARKDEGLECINFGFSQSVPDRCNEKKSNKTKQNFCLLNAQVQAALPWQLAQAATQTGSAAPTPRPTIHPQ